MDRKWGKLFFRGYLKVDDKLGKGAEKWVRGKHKWTGMWGGANFRRRGESGNKHLKLTTIKNKYERLYGFRHTILLCPKQEQCWVLVGGQE